MTMQIGRMLGNLVAHNVLTDCQAEDLVVSAAPDAKAVWITCMDADDIPWHLGYAVNAGQHEPQLTMRQLAEQQALHQVGCCAAMAFVDFSAQQTPPYCCSRWTPVPGHRHALHFKLETGMSVCVVVVVVAVMLLLCWQLLEDQFCCLYMQVRSGSLVCLQYAQHFLPFRSQFRLRHMW